MAAVQPQPDTARPAPVPMPTWVFEVALGWLLVLLSVFTAYHLSDAMRDALPTHLGRLPVGTVWFGGLGGSVVSFTGIFWHNRDWDQSYNYWHALRPLIGVVTGGVGCLLLLATTELATSLDSSSSGLG